MHFALKCISFCPSKKQASQLILSPGSAECGSLSGGRSGSRRSREERPSIRFVPHITAPRYGTRALYSTMWHGTTRPGHGTVPQVPAAPSLRLSQRSCQVAETPRLLESLLFQQVCSRRPVMLDGSIWLPPLIYPSFYPCSAYNKINWDEYSTGRQQSSEVYRSF